MRFYHMIVEDNFTGERYEHISRTQGATPRGCKLIGVCGYHEKPTESNDPYTRALQMPDGKRKYKRICELMLKCDYLSPLWNTLSNEAQRLADLDYDY